MASSITTSAASDVCLNTKIINNNPLLHITGLPKFQSMVQVAAAIVKTEEVGTEKSTTKEEDGIVSYLTPAVTESLQTLDEEWKAFEDTLTHKIQNDDNTGTPSPMITYDEVVPVLERIQYPISYIWGIAGHLNGVRNSDGLRTVYEANQPKVVQTMSKFQQSPALYQALESILHTNDKVNTLSLAQQRAIELSIRSMKLGGVGLQSEEEKTKFNDIKQKLAQLSNTFSNNVLDATKAFSLTITDKSKLEKVPQSALDLWYMAHQSYLKQQQQKDTTEEKDETTTSSAADGPWRITLDAPSYMAVLQHVSDREIRETVYRAHITRASEISTTPSTPAETESTEEVKDKNNVPLIYEILQLKHEMATMLGYTNYAEMSLASKMAPSLSAISDLSNLITKEALPAAQKELEDITTFAKEIGFDANETLKPWDISFWSERLKESKFELTEEETRPYFALPAVLDGMFALVERIFNIKVVEAPKGDIEVWHNDVQYFKVYDVNNMDEEIAGFYLDPYSRPENKRGGAWMDVCIGKSDAVNHKVPVAYLTCNGSPPVLSKQQPSLMTFREVETLFHEFGHGLQHMLTTVTVGDVAGINGIEWDAVELPSQFMENWYVVFGWNPLFLSGTHETWMLYTIEVCDKMNSF
jgi:oligopeptidase A